MTVSRPIVVCSEDELLDGGVVRVPVEETGTEDTIAVFKDDGEIYALYDTCRHANASLAEGWVETRTVECPLHGGTFDLRTGAALSFPATEAVRTHEITVRDGAAWVLPTHD